MSAAEATVTWLQDERADAPLVVLLHGRGGDEQDILALGEYLPEGVAYVALRGPLPADSGFTWYERDPDTFAEASSLQAARVYLEEALETVAPEERPVLLVGFSAGAVLASACLLERPERYVGAAICSGLLLFDVGLPTHARRLSDKYVLVTYGEADPLLPKDRLEAMIRYLVAESGADTVIAPDAGGHALSLEALGALRELVETAFALKS